MADLRVKSISYKLISEGFDIYRTDQQNEILINKHCCADCKTSWNTDITECYFCGTINPYLYFCKNCKIFTSTKGGKKECKECNTLKQKICFNDSCVTNSEEFYNIFNINLKNYEGVMSRESPCTVSQTYCFSCGSTNNINLAIIVKIIELNVDEKIKISAENLRFDYIIFTKKEKKEYFICKPSEYLINKKEKFIDKLEINKMFLDLSI